MLRSLLIVFLLLLAACASTSPSGGSTSEPVIAAAGGSAGAAGNSEGWDHTARALTDGRILTPPPITFSKRAELDANLRAAKAALDADPTSEDAIIWYGRRLAYLYRYTEAIDAFSRGLVLHPTSYRLLRHRGHRYITVRRFDLAEKDLRLAATLAEGTVDQVEPDGAPNAAGVPLSTDHSNIWYHLALAQYLEGKFEAAAGSWARCVEIRKDNPDSLVSGTYWHYMTLRRLGRDAEAKSALEPIRKDMKILENKSYFAMLLMFKGQRSRISVYNDAESNELDAATVGYGLGMAAVFDGDVEAARGHFERITTATMWPAFGHIASEAELGRMK